MAASIDQQNITNVAGNDQFRKTSSDAYSGHSTFTSTRNAGVTNLEIFVGPNGVPNGIIWAEVWTNNAGVPGAKIGSSSATLDFSTISSNNYYSFTFSSNYPQVMNGSIYWIVLRSTTTIDGTNFWLPITSTNIPPSRIQRSADGVTWANGVNQSGAYKEWSDTALFFGGGGFLANFI